MAQNRVLALVGQSLDATTISGSNPAAPFTALAEACFLLRITNTTNVSLLVSYNNDAQTNDIVPAGQTLSIGSQQNAQPTGNVALFAKGTVVYVSGSPTSGVAYLAGYYTSSV